MLTTTGTKKAYVDRRHLGEKVIAGWNDKDDLNFNLVLARKLGGRLREESCRKSGCSCRLDLSPERRLDEGL